MRINSFSEIYFTGYGRAAAAAAEESPGRVQPPSHHAQGFNIPFGHTPHSDLISNNDVIDRLEATLHWQSNVIENSGKVGDLGHFQRFLH